jgi:hypothetical protein
MTCAALPGEQILSRGKNQETNIKSGLRQTREINLESDYHYYLLSKVFPTSSYNKKSRKHKEKGRKGKYASSTENRRLVWERIVWPLILQVNREYFTFEEYRTKRDKFCSIYTNVSPFRLSRGLTSLVERAILIKKSRTSNLYSIHYRLVPYMRKGLNLEYRLAVKKTYAKA